MSDANQAPEQAPKLSVIEQYRAQLNMFKAQRDNVKVQYEQLQGAIFACETMIKQYEDGILQEVKDRALKAQNVAPITGENANGEAICETEKQVA